MTSRWKHIFEILITGLISLTGTPLPSGFAHSFFTPAANTQAKL
ncbi:MAG: hypothetical protein ACYC46_06605 [Acidobacteriaceae bacterium]